MTSPLRSVAIDARVYARALALAPAVLAAAALLLPATLRLVSTFWTPTSFVAVFALAFADVLALAFAAVLAITLAEVTSELVTIGLFVAPYPAVVAMTLELGSAAALHSCQVVSFFASLAYWILALALIFLSNVHIHVVAVELLARFPIFSQCYLLQDKLPGFTPGLQTAVALEVPQEVRRKHGLEGGPLGQVREWLLLEFRQFLAVILPLDEASHCLLVRRHGFGMVNTIRKPLQTNPTASSNFTSDLVPRLAASDALVVAQILDGLQGSARRDERQDAIQLLVIPKDVDLRIVLRRQLRLVLQLPNLGLLVEILDPVKKLLEVLERPHELLELKLEVREIFLISVERRDLVEALLLGEVLLVIITLPTKFPQLIHQPVDDCEQILLRTSRVQP